MRETLRMKALDTAMIILCDEDGSLHHVSVEDIISAASKLEEYLANGETPTPGADDNIQPTNTRTADGYAPKTGS